MANQRQWNRLFAKGRSAAIAALAFAVVVALTFAAPQVAQAQPAQPQPAQPQPAQPQTSFKVLHTFQYTDGAKPYAGLTMDNAGNLYGATVQGWSTVFKLTRGSGWTLSPISQYFYVLDRVIFGPDGRLYGTSSGTLGDVFSLAPPFTFCRSVRCFWTETELYGFKGADGSYPKGEIVFDQGNIYGTTYLGGSKLCGADGCGLVYELTPSGSGWTESVLYKFSGSDGRQPNGVLPNAGKLYGTTQYGGSSDVGTAFELTYVEGVGWRETFLYSFQQDSSGYYPAGGLIADASGNLYGSTADGGYYRGGTVFKLTPSGGGWTHSLIYSFTGDGVSPCGPVANLAMDGAGNLYGTTQCDGAYHDGTVFKLTPSGDSWTYTSLIEFDSGPGGGLPTSNVIFDASGNLYGTTPNGGSDNNGVVWEITP